MAKQGVELSKRSTVLKEKIYYKLLRIGKRLYNWIRSPKCYPPCTILYILGCQRSGTTLMTRIFERDINTKVYAEKCQLTSQDRPKQLRLNPLAEVRVVLAQGHAPLVVLKPLVESQRVHELFTYFEESKAIWLYRHYRDVAASYVTKWGEGHSVEDLRIIAASTPGDWRSENVSQASVEIVRRLFSEQMDSYDASALYWFVRNSLYYSLDLDAEPRVHLLKYEDLAARPADVMQQVYCFLGRDYPGDRLVSMVHGASIAKGHYVKLSPEIDRLCADLLARLDKSYGI
jgi:hypothetical protein